MDTNDEEYDDLFNNDEHYFEDDHSTPPIDLSLSIASEPTTTLEEAPKTNTQTRKLDFLIGFCYIS